MHVSREGNSPSIFSCVTESISHFTGDRYPIVGFYDPVFAPLYVNGNRNDEKEEKNMTYVT